MKPFFSYYGSKYLGAKHYGPPRSTVVIEPFAGSAAYSVRWEPEQVRLYDLSEDICLLWDFLIKCSKNDIKRIPDFIESNEHLSSLPIGPQLLCRFWVAKGRAEPASKLSSWYLQHRTANDCRVWGPKVKARILEQKPKLKNWTIDLRSYEEIEPIVGHWHVDAPYNNFPGSKYPKSSKRINFEHLSEWCRKLPGEVDVCENSGATWLPFHPLYKTNSTRGKKSGAFSNEALYRQSEGVQVFDDDIEAFL